MSWKMKHNVQLIVDIQQRNRDQDISCPARHFQNIDSIGIVFEGRNFQWFEKQKGDSYFYISKAC